MYHFFVVVFFMILLFERATLYC